ncbi:glycosyltransferase family 4 protein, partial [Providencia stuartii]|uniref:glycosyltransferase family 4 protein n=3 Tax=Providencia TaxID=586 RepID=UPI0033170562
GYNTHVLRNWAEVKPTSKSNSYRTTLSLQNKIIYFYGGNIGHAQDMYNLMKLAREMKKHSDAHFLFVGQGDEVNLVQKLIEKWKLKNTTYLPSLDQNEFKKLLSEVDIGLFSLAKEHTSHNFPGKLLGYMVQSIPILGSVNAGNDLIPLINQSNSGYIHVNGEDDLLLQSAISLYNDKKIREEMGNNGFKLLQNEFNVTTIASSIIKKLGI